MKNVNYLNQQKSKYISLQLLINEAYANNYLYKSYFENSEQNLRQYIQRQKKRKNDFYTQEEEEKISAELQNQNELKFEVFLEFSLNYYCCLLKLAQNLEGINQDKAYQVYEHIIDLLKCLESNESLEKETIDQMSSSCQPSDQEEEKKQFTSNKISNQKQMKIEMMQSEISDNQVRFQQTISERIENLKTNISDLFQVVF